MRMNSSALGVRQEAVGVYAISYFEGEMSSACEDCFLLTLCSRQSRRHSCKTSHYLAERFSDCSPLHETAAAFKATAVVVRQQLRRLKTGAATVSQLDVGTYS